MPPSGVGSALMRASAVPRAAVRMRLSASRRTIGSVVPRTITSTVGRAFSTSLAAFWRASAIWFWRSLSGMIRPSIARRACTSASACARAFWSVIACSTRAGTWVANACRTAGSRLSRTAVSSASRIFCFMSASTISSCALPRPLVSGRMASTRVIFVSAPIAHRLVATWGATGTVSRSAISTPAKMNCGIRITGIIATAWPSLFEIAESSRPSMTPERLASTSVP